MQMAVFVLISYDLSGVQHLQFLKVRIFSEYLENCRLLYVIMYFCYNASMFVVCGNGHIK